MKPDRTTIIECTRSTGPQSGTGLLEFVMVALPVIFITISILEMGLQSWKFHSMLYAIDVAARYACAHGKTCSRNGNTCTIQVKDVASIITTQAPALDTSRLNVTLTPATASAAVNCNPLSSCTTTNCPSGATCTNNTAQFPGATDNGVGLSITISATYTMNNPIPMSWFGAGSVQGQNYTLGAKTLQTIVY
jgi:Flp pilus assembly protein TadG